PSAGAYGRRAEALAPGLRSRKGCFGGVGKEDPLRRLSEASMLRRGVAEDSKGATAGRPWGSTVRSG
ncbi:MAG: hypothetical protein OEY86_17225, partial [Nitrospira sp.]|nr:hypothetical protein [Nitrospira sp.]